MIQFSYQVEDGTYKEGLPVFLDEANSMAAEHLLYGPITGWIEAFGDLERYYPGSPLTYWDDLYTDNYINSYLFGQYLRTRYAQLGHGDGSGIYRAIMEAAVGADKDALTVTAELLGTTDLQLVKDFWTAVYLMKPTGKHGFNGESWADEIDPMVFIPEEGSYDGIYNGGCVCYAPEGATITFEEQTDADVICIVDGEVVSEAAEDDPRLAHISVPSDVTVALADNGYPWVWADGRAQSSNQGAHATESTMKLTFTTTRKGQLRFTLGVSSEADQDVVSVSVNGVKQIDRSGESTDACKWSLKPGAYTVEVIYQKDGAGSSGSDCAWIEDFTLEYFPTEGTCGDHANWSYDPSTGELHITGTGELYDYSNTTSYGTGVLVPWEPFMQEITALRIDRGITYIGDHAFDNIRRMTSVSIPDTVTGLGDYAFQGCDDLISVSLPDSLTAVGEAVFNGCGSLKEIWWPALVTDIPRATFGSCYALTQVTFRGKLKTIGERAFYRCESLTSCTLPDTVTEIGESAFRQCTALAEVTIPASVKKIGTYAFYESVAIKDVWYGGSPNQWSMIAIGENNDPLTQATIHYAKENDLLFEGLRKALSEKLIGEITLSEAAHPWVWKNDRFESTAQGISMGVSELRMALEVKRDCTLRFRYGVSSEDTYDTFEVILDGVTAVGRISGSVTGSHEMELQAGTTAVLTFLYRKDSIVSKGDDLAWIDDLSVTERKGNLTWDYDPDTDTLTIGGSGAMEDYGGIASAPWAAYAGTARKVIIGDDVTYIGAMAFLRFSALEQIDFGSSVTEIGDYAFSECTNLESLTLPDNVKKLGAYACSSRSLSSLDLGEGLKHIREGAFWWVEELQSLTIPDSVTVIDAAAFYNCKSIKVVYMGSGVQTIGASAFGDCFAIKDVYYNGTRAQWNGVNVEKDNGYLRTAIIHCVDDAPTKFTMVGSNMTLGNELEVNFLFKKDDLTKTGCTAVITQELADGTTRVTKTAQANWSTMGTYHKVSVRITAKEMADPLSIQIFDADENVLNEPYVSSVRDYAGRALASSTTTAKVATMMVDMLNYGASAQAQFGYNTKDLANNALTEAQAAKATQKVICTNDQVKGINLHGANLGLQDRIEMNVYFKGFNGKDRSKMYAVIRFTDYKGNAKDARVEGSEFVKMTNDIYGVIVDEIVLADARSMVSVTVYDANGVIHGTGSDSVSSYVARAEANNADTYGLFANIMKFATSAHNYLA